jgi:hypothetical protein
MNGGAGVNAIVNVYVVDSSLESVPRRGVVMFSRIDFAVAISDEQTQSPLPSFGSRFATATSISLSRAIGFLVWEQMLDRS